jgi:histidine ammonia-lyase/phenylalanine ammonia-lyase
MNSVTDNPLIDYETGEIYSGGNFYGGHICSSMDSLRATICNVADLVDKQIELIIDEKFNCGLTPNLIDANTDKPYIRHGLKAVQITSTSLVAEIMSFANPISSLSRPTEALNQDKVSLGTISARHTRDVIQLMMYLISTQLISLCQAIELRGVSKFSNISKEIFSLIRTVSKFVSEDRELDVDIEDVKNLLLNDEIYKIISKYSV